MCVQRIANGQVTAAIERLSSAMSSAGVSPDVAGEIRDDDAMAYAEFLSRLTEEPGHSAAGVAEEGRTDRRTPRSSFGTQDILLSRALMRGMVRAGIAGRWISRCSTTMLSGSSMKSS